MNRRRIARVFMTDIYMIKLAEAAIFYVITPISPLIEFFPIKEGKLTFW